MFHRALYMVGTNYIHHFPANNELGRQSYSKSFEKTLGDYKKSLKMSLLVNFGSNIQNKTADEVARLMDALDKIARPEEEHAKASEMIELR